MNESETNPSGTEPVDITPSGTEPNYIKTFDNWRYAILKPFSVYVLITYYPRLERLGWSVLVQVSKSDTIHKAYYSIEPPNDKKGGERIGPVPENSQWRIKHTANDRWPLLVADYPITQSKSPLVVGLVRVSPLDPSDSNGTMIDKIMRMEDQDNFKTFNNLDSKSECVYVGRVCERLKAAGMVWFDKWDDVEHEIFTFGEKNKEACTVMIKNKRLKPLPVMNSFYCGLDDEMVWDE